LSQELYEIGCTNITSLINTLKSIFNICLVFIRVIYVNIFTPSWHHNQSYMMCVTLKVIMINVKCF